MDFSEDIETTEPQSTNMPRANRALNIPAAIWAIILAAPLAVVQGAEFGPSPSLEATAIVALQRVTAQDGCSEQAGLIVREPSGAYRVTAPVRGSQDHFTLRVLLRPGERFVALYHTHPLCGAKKTDVYFSPDDVATANKYHVPSFIWVSWDSSIRAYYPSRSHTVALPVGLASLGTTLTHWQCMMRPIKWDLAGNLEQRRYCIGG